MSIAKSGLKGIYVSENIYRQYPYGKLLSQTLGYLTSDSVGQSGVESYYNSVLSGTNGKYLTQSDVRGITLNNSLNYYVEAVDGLNLSLTIDINIQKSIERELDNIVDMFTPDNALAIVMDPNTGEILGMSSFPSYDPNNYKSYSTEVLSRNLPIFSSYEPGSTFKIITLAASLEEKTINILSSGDVNSKTTTKPFTVNCNANEAYESGTITGTCNVSDNSKGSDTLGTWLNQENGYANKKEIIETCKLKTCGSYSYKIGETEIVSIDSDKYFTKESGLRDDNITHSFNNHSYNYSGYQESLDCPPGYECINCDGNKLTLTCQLNNDKNPVWFRKGECVPNVCKISDLEKNISDIKRNYLISFTGKIIENLEKVEFFLVYRDGGTTYRESISEKVAGGKYAKEIGTTKNARFMLKDYYEALGLDMSGVQIFDGSGVSRMNLVTSSFVTFFICAYLSSSSC